MMLRFLLVRLSALVLIVWLVNFAGFTYAHVALRVQQAQNPFGAGVEGAPPVLELYAGYLSAAAGGDFGAMPIGVDSAVRDALAQAAAASLGLMAIVFSLSALAGVVIGLGAVHVQPAGVARWLAPLATLGLASPSFYIGTLLIAAAVAYVLGAGPDARSPVPLSGFGWDAHLILPVVALAVRPTAQIAQTAAALLSGELDKQYVTAARALGQTWRLIRWKTALRNVLAPLALTLAGSLRLLVGELILIEYLFAWPGLGRLLAQTLIEPRGAGPGALFGHTVYFLHPELVAALLAVFAFLFLLSDALASLAARAIDPRLGVTEGGDAHA